MNTELWNEKNSFISNIVSDVYYSDVDECLSLPCENGGSCDDKTNGYICLCSAGYTGTCCETGKI